MSRSEATSEASKSEADHCCVCSFQLIVGGLALAVIAWVSRLTAIPAIAILQMSNFVRCLLHMLVSR